MKRSELTVGEAYYYAKPWQWERGVGSKAVVVDAGRWGERKGFGYHGDKRFYKMLDGERGAGGVLVDMFDRVGPDRSPMREVVQLAHLRGAYEQVAAEVEEQATRNRRAAEKLKARSDAAAARARLLTERAAGLGVTLRPVDGRVSLSLDDAERLLDVPERIAQAIEAYSDNYPASVFPADSDSRDAIGGTAMRHAYVNAARIAREHGKEQG